MPINEPEINLSAVSIDCDPGWDDALALVLLLAKIGGPNVIGVTTVYGNGTLSQSTENARRLTAYCGKPSLKVYSGSDQSMSPGNGKLPSPAQPSSILQNLPDMGPLSPDNAVDFILSAANQFGPSLTIFAIGPLTNIAKAVQRSPDDMRKVGRLLVVGGAFKTGEFNFRSDPKAAGLTFNSFLNTILIPLETCEQAKSPPGFLAGLRDKGPLAKFYSDIIEEQVSAKNPGATEGLYDQLGALCVLAPRIFTTERHPVRIDPSNGSIILLPEDQMGPTALIAESIDLDMAYRVLLSRLSG
jgi:purine nucleosidase